jgi:UDP-N-acetylmuramate dehydrogenase
MLKALVENLLETIPLACRQNLPASEFSYWKIGGPVKLFVEPNDIQELALAIKLCNAQSDVPFLVVGDGSNLLFDSLGFDGVVIKIGNNLSSLKVDGTNVVCEAGIWVPELTFRLSSYGLSGIEHICGIPGRLGGLVYMNGGSNRRSILENTVSIELINKRGEIEQVYVEDLEFAYRTSPFQKANDERIVARVELKLEKSERKLVRNQIKTILSSRRKKFPRKLPNCGSVFLSDPAMYDIIGPPGFAIEKVGLKGRVRGNAQISPVHANFIVNNGEASSDDVLYLIALARREVYKSTNFLMDCEVRYVYPSGGLVQAHLKADEMYYRELSA